MRLFFDVDLEGRFYAVDERFGDVWQSFKDDGRPEECEAAAALSLPIHRYTFDRETLSLTTISRG